MIKNHEGRPSGCAYATFEKAADYEEALKKTMSYIGEFTMLYIILSEKRSSGFPTRSDTNRPVQSQKQARSLKFWLY